MRWWYLVLLVLVAAGGSVSANDLSSDFANKPKITAQGFSINTALRAEAGRFTSVRVRIEAPARIARLLVSEGDFETDLAGTPDRSMFALFGLSQRPMHAYDVTLDLARFMNEKLKAPATYRIVITVVDRDGATESASLSATVVTNSGNKASATSMPAPAQRLRESVSTLTREADGSVAPADESPLSWTTREAVDVTIRLRPAAPYTEIRQLAASAAEAILTRASLTQYLNASPALPYVDVPAARNGAAGTVLALRGDHAVALIQITSSDTQLSRLGTTVTLAATIRD